MKDKSDKKAKLIHLNPKDLDTLNTFAKNQGTDLKKYLQNVLIDHINQTLIEDQYKKRDFINNLTYFIKTERNVYTKVNLHNIIMIETSGHYSEVFVKGSYSFIVIAPIYHIYKKLSSYLPSFYRLNRSTVINLNYVERIQGYEIILDSIARDLINKRLIISRSSYSELSKKIEVII